MPKDWKGDIVFTDTVAIFRGFVGENNPHSHWASQLTIALDGEVEYVVTAGVQRSKAVYFSSKTEHRLLSGFICSIYFDPLANSVLNTLNINTPDRWAPLSEEELPHELRSINASTHLRELLALDSLRPMDISHASDDRLSKTLQEIKRQIREGNNVDRDFLAQLVNLSPTRFSHWFVEQTGVPLRSYKKWLKLRMAMDALLDGNAPMQAAMLAGFSDLAHMSREFSDSFGLTYLDAQRAWEMSNKH